jgi:anti-sigma regulatory factor (Ser/Thr protein kinase)
VRHAAASASKARRRLADDLGRRGLPREAIQDAALVLSEMVANAVRYAHPLPGNVLLATWDHADDRLMLRVTDGGGRGQPQVRDAGPSDTRGRGLAIVDTVAAAWGVKRRGAGIGRSRTVWAEVSTGPAGKRSAGAVAAESGRRR